MDNKLFKLKERILEENVNNTGPRRSFSPLLKKDIVEFIKNYQLSSTNASQLIGIGMTTLEKWRRAQKFKIVLKLHKILLSLVYLEYIV